MLRVLRCGCKTSATVGTEWNFPTTATWTLAEYYKRYAETMLAVDEGLGRIVDLLKAKGMLDSTLIIFMGDNGFSFGEHG